MRDQAMTGFLGGILGGQDGGEPDAVRDLRLLEGLGLDDELRLHATLDACRADLTAATPIYALPLGTARTFPLELHLRPSDVRTGRLAFLSAEGAGRRIEIASSPRHLLYLTLLRLEAYADATGDDADLREAHDRAVAAFGPDFYAVGKHPGLAEDEAGQVAAATFGPAPLDVLEASLFADDRTEKVALLEQGVVREPGCLELHAKLAFRHRDGGDDRAAARSVASALHCFHHTAYSVDLEELYDLGRSLLRTVPEAFDDVLRRDLETSGDQERLLWVMQEYDAGDVELATKLLCDMCHARRDYASVVDLFRKHFERLGWAWGVALCDLRR